MLHMQKDCVLNIYAESEAAFFMGRNRISPTEKELEELLRQGYTHEDIVEQVYQSTGVRLSRSTISVAIGRAGLTSQNRYTEEVPWTVATKYLRQYQPKMLRILGRRRAGLELSDVENDRLDKWLAKLDCENAVVVYDPNRGFGYAERVASDPKDLPIHPIDVELN